MTIILILSAVIGILLLFLWGYDWFVDPQKRIDPKVYETVRFPTVNGSNLSGERFTLPGDIEAEYALLMIAFKQRQQLDVNTWLPVVQDVSNIYEQLVYYELPTIDRLNPAARAFIDGGMRGGIPDPVARATTITLYLDKSSFREVLDIGNEDAIVVMLINRDGEVFWRVDGPASTEKIEEMQDLLNLILG